MTLGEHFLQLRGHCVAIHKLSLLHKPVNAKYGHTLMSSWQSSSSVLEVAPSLLPLLLLSRSVPAHKCQQNEDTHMC